MLIKENFLCMICSSDEIETVIDLGASPVANKFYTDRNVSVQSFPLVLDFCSKCFNLQLRHSLDAEYLYDHTYSYATPVAASLDSHYAATLKKLVELDAISGTSSLLEIGSNNGNFLAAIKGSAGRILGIDPATNMAAVASARGIPTIVGFFNETTARVIDAEFGKADLVIARHMFAHNSAPSEMIQGVKACLAPGGNFLVENAYAIETLLQGEFDQIYHEHMFYYSASSMNKLMEGHGLELYDVSFSNVHGGSASFFISNIGQRTKSPALKECLERERRIFESNKTFSDFRSKVEKSKLQVSEFLQSCRNSGESIAIYSAPNKLFTFLSLTEFPLEIVEFIVDTSREKIGRFYPNSNIEIISEIELNKRTSDVFFIGAWNYKREILKKSTALFKPGTKLVFALPHFDIVVV